MLQRFLSLLEYDLPPSNAASTVQTQPCTCRVLSNCKSPQYASSSECLPPTPLPRPSQNHPTGSETIPSAPASVPSRTPSPLPSLPTDSSLNFPSARAATCRARESLHQSSAGCGLQSSYPHGQTSTAHSCSAKPRAAVPQIPGPCSNS